MGLRGLHAAAAQVQCEAVVRDQVGVQGVAGLMGDHIHIPGRPVEVCQDKGLAVLLEFRAVTAAPLVFAAVHVKGLVFQHHVDEGSGFRSHGVIHLPGRGKDLPFAEGLRISARQENSVVVEHVVLHSEPFCIFRAQAGHHRNHIPQDVFPEDADLLLVVAEPAHPVIPQLDEVAVSHLFRHAVTDMDHTVINLVQLFLMRREPFSENLIAFPPGFPVLTFGILHQQRAGHGLAAEGKLHPAHEVGVFPNQLVLLDHIPDDLRRHGLAFHFHRPEQDGRKLLLQLPAEGGIQQRGGILDGKVLHRGADLVVILILGDIEFIHGVDGIAHVSQRRVGLILQHELLLILAGGQDFICRACIFDPGDHVLHDGGNFFDGDSAIGQFGYFHGVYSCCSLLMPRQMPAGPAVHVRAATRASACRP